MRTKSHILNNNLWESHVYEHGMVKSASLYLGRQWFQIQQFSLGVNSQFVLCENYIPIDCFVQRKEVYEKSPNLSWCFGIISFFMSTILIHQLSYFQDMQVVRPLIKKGQPRCLKNKGHAILQLCSFGSFHRFASNSDSSNESQKYFENRIEVEEILNYFFSFVAKIKEILKTGAWQ